MSRLTTLVSYLEMHALPSSGSRIRADLTLRARAPADHRVLSLPLRSRWRAVAVDRSAPHGRRDAANILTTIASRCGCCTRGACLRDTWSSIGESPPDIELGYFGLMPEFIGQKLGPWLLDQAIRRAWSYAPKRFWVHTQTLDIRARLRCISSSAS